MTVTAQDVHAILEASIRRPVCRTLGGCRQHVKFMPMDTLYPMCMFLGCSPEHLATYIFYYHKKRRRNEH